MITNLRMELFEALVFTIFGEAQTVTLVQVASCTLAEARSLGSAALIIAHELAHNLGVEHDGVGDNSGELGLVDTDDTEL